MDAPLWGDTGGHTGTAPTHLHHIFPHNPTQTKEPFTRNQPKRNQPPTRNPHKQKNIYAQSNQRKPTVHVQSAPTHLHQITRCAPTPSPPNHAVCHYPIGVVLSIAQGRQVQRSLPWVTMQARRLPHWGLYFFSSHIITTRDE